MLDVLVLHEIADRADVDRLLVLLARADPKRKAEAAELVRRMIPLPAVIDILEAA